MALWSRKFRIWLISIGIVLAVYLLYSKLSKTPRIEIDTGRDKVADSNVGELGDKVGMIGNVGVGDVRKARYEHLNKQKQIDRVLGFDRLLHQSGNEWEVKKPYMNVFRRDLGCYITADLGNVWVETAGGRPSPRDAKFTGNVVAHIVPEASSDIKEGFLYLNDVTFISDKSQFTTPGPVKYTSEDLQMFGTGLELIYNEQMERIELLRITNLESLHLKSTQAASLSTATTESDRPTDANSRIKTQQQDKTIAVDDSPEAEILPDANTQPPAQKKDQRYKCVFSKNVLIDTPEQLIFASEQLTIDNIFRPETSDIQSDKTGPDAEKRPTKENTENVEKELEPNSAGSPNSPAKPDQIPVDIVITCEKGLVITPIDVNKPDTNSVKVSNETSVVTAGGKLKQFEETDGRTILIAHKIDYCAVSRDTIAGGPLELKFYTSDPVRPEANEATIPVKITAQKQARFLPAIKQAVFEGDSVCTMQREDPNSRRTYTLSAPKLTVDLPKDKDEPMSASAANIEHLTTGGGTAKLAIFKTAKQESRFADGPQYLEPEKLLGGVELKCARIDYDAKQQLFLATGPGVIKVDNSKISEPDPNASRFSLRRRCFALVEKFDTLKYFLETNQIIAEAEEGGVDIGYLPIVDGEYGKRVKVTAGRIEANLVETAASQTELSTLHATGGVIYKEEGIEFKGSKLFHDAAKSIITVRGDESNPCVFNGALVDAIEYDLKTGTVKAEIVGPGALKMKR